jgi:hypothetical protein
MHENEVLKEVHGSNEVKIVQEIYVTFGFMICTLFELLLERSSQERCEGGTRFIQGRNVT